jgi:hypothetical protein
MRLVRGRSQPRGWLTFFLSTGRCGTQWLAQTLRGSFSDVAEVRHDPIGARYHPRDYFRQWDRAHQAFELPDAAAELSFIRKTLRSKTYIDTGWAHYAALPYFIGEFPGRVRLVHLVRHPVPTAASYVSLDMYAPDKRRDEWSDFAFVDATSPGIQLTEYQGGWSSMTPFEKNLFWWTEMNLYAEELASMHPQVPFLRVRSEDMFQADGTSLRALVRFLCLPWRTEMAAAREQRIDRWRFEIDGPIDPALVLHYPRTLDMMRRYGYDPAEWDAAVVNNRGDLAGVKPWRPSSEA